MPREHYSQVMGANSFFTQGFCMI